MTDLRSYSTIAGGPAAAFVQMPTIGGGHTNSILAGTGSTVIGNHCTNHGDQCIVVGNRITNRRDRCIAIGRFIRLPHRGGAVFRELTWLLRIPEVTVRVQAFYNRRLNS